MKTPDYVLSEDFVHHINSHEMRTVPKGAFVKPLELCYVPKHVLDDRARPYHNKERDVFVYCHYGIVSVPKSIVRKCE